ncbi:PEP-CTERM sorting domain-containing protein [Roseateles sp.]|uniref:PEP-CTERM sorting domain-containing protein n=1 Tax=Roseateles sp. TaxID=1971397 RepID=UPI0039EAE70E
MQRLAQALTLTATAAALAAGPAAFADTLTVNGTADDFFKLYIATELGNPGSAAFDKTSGWSALGSASITLQPGQSVYLLIDADNAFGGPAMLLADFTLSGGSLRFANGQTSLTTDTVNWKVSEASFAAATQAPVSMGLNQPGLQIWGQFAGVSAQASAIWAYEANWATGHTGHAYFVTQITAVPEPATTLLWLGGAALLAGLRRRTRQRS